MLLLALLPCASAQNVSGFVELRGGLFLGVDGTPAVAVQRFRPTFEVPLSDRVELVTTVEATLSEGRVLQNELERTVAESDLEPLFRLAGCEWAERPPGPFHIDGPGDVFFVDRLYLDAYLPKADIRIGRQAVQWGSAVLFNPTDPLPQVLFTEPWRPRVGQNAIRTTIPLGDHQTQLFLGTDDRIRQIRAAGRATLNAGGADLSAVGAYRSDAGGSGIVGLDIKGTLGVGYWFEGALHIDPELAEEFAVGIDYSLPVFDLLLIGAQYYRNGRGSPEPPGLFDSALASDLEPPLCDGVDLADAFPAPSEDPFAPFALGRDYLMLTLLAQIVPEVKLTAGAVQNLGDGTGVVVPTLTVVPVGWLEVSASAQLPYRAWGDGGELKPSVATQTLEVGLPGLPPVQTDLTGLVPDGVVYVWTRANF
ncbi:MAG: hypothetical protein R3F61_05390 [Myxococcota bacterium]